MPGTICFLNRAEAVELRPHPRSITGRPGRLWLGLATGEKVLFLQNLSMVQLMSCDGVSQGAYRHFILAGHAAARPGLLVEIAQQREGGAADRDVILNDFRQGGVREGAVTDVVILLEAFHRRLVAAGNAQGAVGEDALGVGSSRVDLQACKLEYSIVSPK